MQVVSAEKSPQEAFAAAALGVLLASSSVVGPLLASPEPAHAARSGGRAGGSRSFRSAPPPRAPSGGAGAPGKTTVINRNYYGGSPGYGGGGVVISPMVSPFGYSPFGGMGTGYALGSMAAGSNRMETYRLENKVENEQDKVRDVEFELQLEKQKAADLERRLEALENK